MEQHLEIKKETAIIAAACIAKIIEIAKITEAWADAPDEFTEHFGALLELKDKLGGDYAR